MVSYCSLEEVEGLYGSFATEITHNQVTVQLNCMGEGSSTALAEQRSQPQESSVLSN